MEFGFLNCAMISLHRGRKARREGIQLPNGEEIGEAGAGEYKYLGILDKII